jgi:hypothetical protein
MAVRTMSPLSELGRSRLYTRRERRRRLGAVLLAVLGALVAVWVAAAVVAWVSTGDLAWPSLGFRSPLTGGSGHGGWLGLPGADRDPGPDRHAHANTAGDADAPRRPQVPVTVTWPAGPEWTAVVALGLWLAWLRFAVRPVLGRLREAARHRGLAAPQQVHRVLGVRAVRRAGRYTLPGTTRWRRLLLPAHAFGYHLGFQTGYRAGGPHRRPGRGVGWTRSARGCGMRLWADWEQRIRVVARTGWGKTDRVLVPIIRALSGPALVASIEPGIFDKTVLARRFRRPTLRWRWMSLLLRHWLPMAEYPVAVVDMSAPGRRYAAGYPQVRWSPIIGCTDYAVAYRRAVALVSGIDTAAHTRGESDNDRFFRDSAGEVLAAWLHAADLAAKDLDDLAEWLRCPDDPTAARVLRDDPRAEPSAGMNITRHLDPAAGRTTSGVLRYLTLALNSLTSAESRQLCGDRDDDSQFDMERMIAAGGTVYLLADSSRLPRVKPLLSLFAGEVFVAAEAVALGGRHRRLPQPFIGVVDELRYGITIPNLPYVASGQRKYGIGYVYGVQTASQEDAVYGPDAAALRAAAGVSIIGGIDIDSADDLSDRAGVTPVVTPIRSSRRAGHATGHSEQIQHQDVLSVADQQRLADGDAVVIARGLAPFLAFIPSYRDIRALNRTIGAEVDAVARQVVAARSRDATVQSLHAAAKAAGVDFTAPGASQ